MTLSLALIAVVPTVWANEQTAPPSPAYRIIVNPKNSAASVGRAFLQDAFLKKSTRWPNDVAIQPVDMRPNSPARVSFSQEVLKRPVPAVRSYWQQRIFSGRDVPPPELDSDEKVVAHVLRYEGAVGYVSGTANVGAAKPVTMTK
jgi:ABC-type phosphate transport system substrate-binding protein